MRLISQNGEFDVPYEIAVLSRTENIIRVYVPIVGEKGTIMATYSTEEKAKIITIELTLRELKLIRDSMYKVSYAELESLNRGKDIPYAYSDLEKAIDEVENILEA